MSGGSDFTGVKLPEFDVMTGKHTQAADRLEELARALHRELQGAGLDTAPAARLRELAAQVGRQAEDLRRRQILIQEMQREKVALGFSVPEGSYLRLPDKLETARALLDGSVAANAAHQAAQGDTKALERLKKYADRAKDAEFTKIFLERLGAQGITNLPGSLARILRDARREHDTEQLNRLSQQAKQVLAMLSESLAQATDPKSAAYAGGAFLDQLQKEGRTEHFSGDVRYSGYQAQALIWAAHDGKPPFSAKFMQTVGQDAIAYEAKLYADRWAASKSYDFAHLSLPDLAGVLGLGTALKPGPGTATASGTKIRTSVVEDLLHAAGSNKEASQALLGHTPPGWKVSILAHLVTTRLDVFKYTHQQARFNAMLIDVTTGQDPNSKKLAAELIKAASSQVGPAFEIVEADGKKNLAISDRAAFDRLEPIAYPLSRAIAANIDELSRALLNRASFDGAGAKEISWALTLAAYDDKGFEALIRAQTEHTRHALGGVPPAGLDLSNIQKYGFDVADLKRFDTNENGVVDRQEVMQILMDRSVEEVVPFRHILATRSQVVAALKGDDEKSNEALRGMVRDAIGMIPVPGAAKVGELATGVFGSLITQSYEKLVNAGYDELAGHVAVIVAAQGRGLDSGYKSVANNEEAVHRLVEQMLATAMLSKGLLDQTTSKGESFVEGDSPKIKPFSEMKPTEYSDFLEWVRKTNGSSDLLGRFGDGLENTGGVLGHFGR